MALALPFVETSCAAYWPRPPRVPHTSIKENGVTNGDSHREPAAQELDARLGVPKNDARLLWLFTAIVVLLATVLPYAGRAAASGLL